MGLYLFKEKSYVLHSSAININGKAFIFMGPSGSGKSSIVASLINYGELITEDISKIEFSGDDGYVYPSLPVIKLDSKIFDHHKFETLKEFNLAGDIGKRKGYVVKNFDHNNSSIKIHGCFILDNEKSKVIEKVGSDDAFRYLMFNSFGAIPKNQCVKSENMLLNNISNFIRSVPIYKISKQKNFSNNIILDFILAC